MVGRCLWWRTKSSNSSCRLSKDGQWRIYSHVDTDERPRLSESLESNANQQSIIHNMRQAPSIQQQQQEEEQEEQQQTLPPLGTDHDHAPSSTTAEPLDPPNRVLDQSSSRSYWCLSCRKKRPRAIQVPTRRLSATRKKKKKKDEDDQDQPHFVIVTIPSSSKSQLLSSWRRSLVLLFGSSRLAFQDGSSSPPPPPHPRTATLWTKTTSSASSSSADSSSTTTTCQSSTTTSWKDSWKSVQTCPAPTTTTTTRTTLSTALFAVSSFWNVHNHRRTRRRWLLFHRESPWTERGQTETVAQALLPKSQQAPPPQHHDRTEPLLQELAESMLHDESASAAAAAPMPESEEKSDETEQESAACSSRDPEDDKTRWSCLSVPHVLCRTIQQGLWCLALWASCFGWCRRSTANQPVTGAASKSTLRSDPTSRRRTREGPPPLRGVWFGCGGRFCGCCHHRHPRVRFNLDATQYIGTTTTTTPPPPKPTAEASVLPRWSSSDTEDEDDQDDTEKAVVAVDRTRDDKDDENDDNNMLWYSSMEVRQMMHLYRSPLVFLLEELVVEAEEDSDDSDDPSPPQQPQAVTEESQTVSKPKPKKKSWLLEKIAMGVD